MKSVKKSFITKLLTTTVFSSTFLISVLSGNIHNKISSNLLLDNQSATSDSQQGKYIITFHANGGSGDMNSVSINNGDFIPRNKFTKDGFHFIGWATSSNASNPEFIDKGIFTKNENVNLYALWSNTAKKLSFKAFGASNNLVDLWVNPNTSITLPRSDGNLYFDGRYFDGWSRSKDGFREINDGSTIVMPNNDLDLYACWIIIDLNTGGSNLKYKNTTKWARGIAAPSESDIRNWNGTDTKEIVWEPYYGFYDFFQGNWPICWAASGSNMLQYWMTQNREYLENTGLKLPDNLEISGQNKGNSSDILNELIRVVGNTQPWGGRQIWSLSWFFNGWDRYPNTGEYLKSLNFNVNDFTENVVSNTKLFNDSIRYIIEEGGTIGIVFANHAYTIFGASFDERGYVSGVYLSNSNDNDVFKHSAIYYKKVYYVNGQPTVINGLGQYDNLYNFTLLKSREDVWEQYSRAHTTITEPKYVEPTTLSASSATSVSSQQELINAVKSESTNIQLAADINVTETISIDRDVSISYNGHKLKGFRGGPVFKVTGNNHNVNFIGSTNNDNEGIFDGNGMVLSSGAIEVTGENNKVLIKGGTYSHNSGRNGGAIYMNSKGGSLLIDGAKINNNTAQASRFGRGGAVYVEKGTVKLASGEMKNNTADFLGGAVAVNTNAKFIMAGGTISGNSVTYENGSQDGGGGAIGALSHGAFIELENGNITNNWVQGEHAYGGAIKDALNSVTVSGPVNVTNNTDKTRNTKSNIALEYKKYKNDDSAISKIKFKNNASITNASNKIGFHFINQGTGVFVDNTGSISISNLFVSDNQKYQIEANGNLKPRENDYQIVVSNNDDSITYGSSGLYRVSLYKNGNKLPNQDVKFLFKGHEIYPSWDGDVAIFGINSVSENLGMELGDNSFQLAWTIDGQTLTKNMNIVLSPSIIENNEIEWENLDNRVAGDGQAVKANIIYKSIYGNDRGRVFIKLNNARNQKPGKYTAYIAGIGGERSKYYKLGHGIPDEYWQKAYTVRDNSQAIIIDGSSKEKTILMDETFHYDFEVSKNNVPLTNGKIQIIFNNVVLKEQRLNFEGKANILFDQSSLLGYGDHDLTIKYISDDGSTTQETTWLLSINREGLKQLYYDGNLMASGEYGVKFSDLKINATSVVKDAHNNEVDGTWKWDVDDFSQKPSASKNKTYKAIFIPNNGDTYKDLEVNVNLDIKKAKQIKTAFIDIDYSTKNSIKVTDYTSRYGTETLYSLDSTNWQPSSLFTGLNSGQTYTVYMKFGGNDNYLDSGVSEGKTVTLPSSSGSQNLQVESNPTTSAPYGTELKDIPISGGSVKYNGSVVSGRWQWEAGKNLNTLHEKPAVGGNKTYKAVFVPEGHDKDMGVVLVDITPTITKANQKAPSTPTLASITKTSIKLNEIASPNGTKTQYRINNGQWQDSPLFNGLNADTNYVFKARYLGNNLYIDSPESSAIYSTEESEESKNATYNISLVSKNDHVEYGQNLSLVVEVKNKNNKKATNGKVRMFRDSTFICEADVIDGRATLNYDTSGKIITAFKKDYDGPGQYVRLTYTSSANRTSSLLEHLVVYKKELNLDWKNTTNRIENDNKQISVVATNLVNGDNLDLYVENVNNQMPGLYTVKVFINQSKELETPWYVLNANNSYKNFRIHSSSEDPSTFNDSNESRNNETTNRPVNNKPKLTGISWIDVMVVKPDCDMNNSDLKLPNELKVWTDSAGSINLPVNWDLNNITSSDKEVDGQKFKNLSINGHIILNDKIDQNDVSLNVTAERLVPQFDKSKKDVELNVVVPDPENTNKATILINKPKNYKIYYSIGDQTPTVDSPLYTEPTEIVNDSTEDKTITIKYLIVDEETNKAVEKSYSFVLKGNTTIDDKPTTNNKSNLTTILAATIPTVGAVGIIGAIAYFFSRRKKRMTR
ncbi:InlB B-repeat-containing protein [Mycoplasma bradburyae]|uniref:InlB B-repeat-containing protein n=1 Tax=Mycoplasma bradburyae TaxID=2963128 RepID=UPI002341B46B|nr:InlB B-repeat-containing protein [Mycoplasma bradburyae]MDC4182635.1 InlB B-repeat-containing protein [Mycoplasma bradburyae]